ncbi:hypothetical protein DB346_05835 [Verrucomicrobia bacterium LW23]|nr:hypothetical protein DB346_05835 [Verrucomicrobia bacterium LW23]
MALDNPTVVDTIGIEAATGKVVLTMFDTWTWDAPLPHLLALQDKLNAYFGFIESGQIYDAYPDAKERSLAIDVITRHPLHEDSIPLYDKALEVAQALKVELRSRCDPDLIIDLDDDGEEGKRKKGAGKGKGNSEDNPPGRANRR